MTKHNLYRLGSLSKSDVNPPRKDPAIPIRQIEAFEIPGGSGPFIQRCVIIQKDERGYGLTVSGDNPVFVQSVKEDGAAARAGVQQGDRIIKVNGTLVTEHNHIEVVDLIKSGSYVALTLLGPPPGGSRPYLQSPGGSRTDSVHLNNNAANNNNNNNNHFHLIPVCRLSYDSNQHHHHGSNMSGSKTTVSPTITPPQPVDSEKQQQVNNERLYTIRKMLEKEMQYLEKLQGDYTSHRSEKLHDQVIKAQKRVQTLQSQLYSIGGYRFRDTTARSPPTSVRSTMSDHRPSVTRSFYQHHHHTASDPFPNDAPPPPPPPRRHPPFTQSSSQGSQPMSSSPPSSIPPVPPVRIESRQHSFIIHHPTNKSTGSCEVDGSVERTISPGPPTPPPIPPGGFPPADKLLSGHCRQRSSPDTLMLASSSPDDPPLVVGSPPKGGKVPRPQQFRHMNRRSHPQQRSSEVSRSHSDVPPASHHPPHPPNRRLHHSSDSCPDLDARRRQSADGLRTGAARASSFGAYDTSSSISPFGTPPGTPPPPYDIDSKQSVKSEHPNEMSSEQIMTMDDDDFPDEGDTLLGDNHGPFNCAKKLEKHLGHLSVFLHYLISNNDPSSLFFYLLTNLYQEGNGKDMKKWAYEIHSTFLVPGGPLKVSNIDESILREIDQVLQNNLENEVSLRTVFCKARKKALEEINELLGDFRSKLTLGLGGVFGPPEAQLEEAMQDKNKELKIIEQLLAGPLETMSEDLENATDRTLATASSLATLLHKQFGVKSPSALSLIDRCPMFVSKERSRIKFLKGKKSVVAQGHHFVPQHFFNVTYCNHCQNIIWGIGNQGFQCQNCQMNIHKTCVKVVEEECIGAPTRLNKKDKKRDRVSGIMDNIIGKTKKPSNLGPVTALERLNAKHKEENTTDSPAFHVPGETDGGQADRPVPSGRVEKLKNRIETVIENEERLISGGNDVGVHSGGSTGSIPAGDDVTPQPESTKRSSISIGRSESLRTTRREQRPSFRKRSDPNIPRANSTDVDIEDNQVVALNNSGSSSNSSLSANLDSPSNSLEAVHRGPADISPLAAHQPPSSSSHLSSHSFSSTSSAPLSSASFSSAGSSSSTTVVPTSLSLGPNASLASNGQSPSPAALASQRRAWSSDHGQIFDDDSDLDAEADPPRWTEGVDWEEVRYLKPKEKKRQDVINELFHTERTHVRNLKVLERVFYRPMTMDQLLPQDQIRLLFPNLDEMLHIHGQLNSKMKKRKQESAIVGNVADILLDVFDGAKGETFREAAATFCKNQSIALEALKARQKKDQKLALFIQDAEANPLCRRFQLKDIIPTGMQRLTKYPLLLENLAKYTSPQSEEHTNLLRALECSKEILSYVNQAVKEAENVHRLMEINKKIDRGPFDRSDQPIAKEYRSLDLTKHRLLHEGPLTWRVRQKNVDLHALLLDDFMLLLLRQDEKYILKFHSTSVIPGRDETKQTHSPIIKLENLLTRNVATDRCAFFLVSTSSLGPQIYELVAISSSDRKAWIRHITEAAEAYKGRDIKNKRSETIPSTAPSIVPTSNEENVPIVPVDDGSRQKESLDITESEEHQEPTEPEPESQEKQLASENGHITSEDVDMPSEVKEKDIDSIDKERAVLVPGSSAITPTSPVSPGGAIGPGNSAQRRFQRVEILKIAEGPPLIEPSEVVISEGAILQTAEPVLTPLECLRRQDQLIREALEEKKNLVADILHIPRDDLSQTADVVTNACALQEQTDMRELLLAAMCQATRLAELINESLSVSEEDAVVCSATAELSNETSQPNECAPLVAAPTTAATSPKMSRRARGMPGAPISKLLAISSSLSIPLTQLLTVVNEREAERERLRKELRSSREQIHILHETSRQRLCVSRSPSDASTATAHSNISRPNSFISITSSETAGSQSSSEAGGSDQRTDDEKDGLHPACRGPDARSILEAHNALVINSTALCSTNHHIECDCGTTLQLVPMDIGELPTDFIQSESSTDPQDTETKSPHTSESDSTTQDTVISNTEDTPDQNHHNDQF